MNDTSIECNNLKWWIWIKNKYDKSNRCFAKTPAFEQHEHTPITEGQFSRLYAVLCVYVM